MSAGHELLLSAEAFRYRMTGSGCPTDSSSEAAEAALRRLWAAAAVFMERLSATDAPQRLALLHHTAARIAAASLSLNGHGAHSAAALSAATAAFEEQLQQPLHAALLAGRQQLLGLVSASASLQALVPADPILADVLHPALIAVGASSSGEAPAEGSAALVWTNASVTARRWKLARVGAIFAARLHAAQEDAASAVQAQRESPLQLAHWRHSQPQASASTAMKSYSRVLV